ncbi:MAG: competence/damage-inducible protein A [bacterium]|nr:competence/damage-inducible protein A [bacterium]
MTQSREAAWIVTIGDELLRGEIVDSNKSVLSERLLRLEIESARHVTVADDAAAIREVLREAASRARIVLVSGGLGPTRDDITSEVAAASFGRKLVRDPESLEHIKGFFRRFQREMAENNAKQADFPEGAEPLPNPAGTAPGFMLDVDPVTGAAGSADPTLLFFMPGVPRELYRMVDEQVLPRIASRIDRRGVVRATLVRTFGQGESNLDRILDDLARDDPDTDIGFRTQFPDNLVRVRVRAESAADAEEKLRSVLDEIAGRLGDVILGESDRFMHEIVGELLLERDKTLAVAESCTGGLIASRLTDVPGSSAYFLQGVVAYANEAKVRELEVDAATLEQHGAVSEPVARQMAEGVRRRSGSDIGLATTGIAGPGGGTPEKPVGTVFLALADAEGTVAMRYDLMSERARNKELSAQIALDWLRRRLLGLEITRETFPRLRGARP